MLTLYHSPFSTCSQKVRIALAEKDVPWTSRVIDFNRQEHLTPEYLRLNPNGVVPTLVHDGHPVVDSSVICEYLDEVYRHHPLSPVDPLRRAVMRSWMRYFEEVPTAAIRVPSFNKLFAKHLASIPKDEFDAMTDKMPLRKHFYRRLGPEGFDARTLEESVERLRATLERADRATAVAPWLVGDEYSIADIVLTPIMVRMDDLGLSKMWSDLPHVAAWYRRVTERLSFAEAFGPGSRLTPGSFRPPRAVGSTGP